MFLKFIFIETVCVKYLVECYLFIYLIVIIWGFLIVRYWGYRDELDIEFLLRILEFIK